MGIRNLFWLKDSNEIVKLISVKGVCVCVCVSVFVCVCVGGGGVTAPRCVPKIMSLLPSSLKIITSAPGEAGGWGGGGSSLKINNPSLQLPQIPGRATLFALYKG